jgi:hypothetical protein
VVIATADARCRTLAANDVILNRFGGRAWGGIGLAAALVLTLGLMSANPRPSVARATGPSNDSALPSAPAARRTDGCARATGASHAVPPRRHPTRGQRDRIAQRE